MPLPLDIVTTSSEDGSTLATIFLESHSRNTRRLFPSTAPIRTWLTTFFNRLSDDQYLPPMGKPLLLKATTNANQIAGFALWRLPDDEEFGVKRQSIAGPWAPGVDADLCERYFNVREVISGSGDGEEFYAMEMLFVHPDFERRGVEQELLAWGLEQASMEGAPVLAIASQWQRGMLEEKGFQVKRVEDFREGVERVFMVKSGRG